ncbi:MAG TPA: SDR family oxidoreductase [Anaerolineae bacterium]|nr:SDR family oxidoreductase [Anaerolineae bacterium]
MSLFHQKIALITGAAAGIGQGLSQELARRGAHVIITDIDAPRLQATADAINALPNGRATPYPLDVTDPQAFQTVIQQTIDTHGRLDYLFNNAGITIAGEMQNLTLDHWHHVLNVNLLGVIHGCHLAYPHMIRQKSGHIVNIASLAGLTPFPANTPYSATKHAVVGLSTTLRVEAAPLGVKVSVVCPAFIQSSIYENSLVIGIENHDILGQLPVKPVATDKAVNIILRGVARNQNIINFPLYGRLIWWLTRLHPNIAQLFGRNLIAQFRTNKAR